MSGESMTTNPVDPGDIRTLTLDYAELLTSLGGDETVDTSTWELPDDLVKVDDDKNPTSTSIEIDFTSAIIGRNYTCYNTVTISPSGQRRRRAMIIPVRDAATFSQASTAKATLDAIRAAMAKTATRAQLRRTIGDKSIEWMSMSELLIAETKFQQLYNQERRNEKIRQGAPFLKNVHTRFLPPG
jgi:hypothetical protein